MKSIIEVEKALSSLSFEVDSSEGQNCIDIIQTYLKEQRDKQIVEGTLIVK